MNHNRDKSRWESVDWSKPDSVIAKEMVVTLAAATYQRKRRGGGIKSTGRSHIDFKPFSLSTLRALKINPLVTIGPERLLVSSLKSRKGEEIVSVDKGEFCRAMNERTEVLWSSNNNES